MDAGGFLAINVGWGLGLVVALYVSIGISGGHLNPAVTFAMALRGKTKWIKVENIHHFDIIMLNFSYNNKLTSCNNFVVFISI